MATDPETTPAPVPAASAGVIERLRMAILGSKPEPVIEESSVVASLNDEISNLVAAATEATAQLETLRASLTEATAARSASDAKITALNAVIPGISNADKPGELLANAVTQAATAQIAAMGLPPGQAPGTESESDGEGPKTLARAEFDALTTSAQNAHIRNGGKIN